MSYSVRIAVDSMGGDAGPHATLPATLAFARANPHVSILLFLEQGVPEPISVPQNIVVHACAQSVAMNDSPSAVLRHKQSSSMAMAVSSVRDGQADVVLSSGNTGALMAFGVHLLGTFDDIRRPAICKPIPTLTGQSFMLDLGANASADANLLAKFAILGNVFAREIGQVPAPRVALLNIGLENQKGHEVIQAAQNIIRGCSGLNYVGFIEGDSIYSGDVDVIVCDGFVGNVALKVSEGVARMALAQLKASFRQNLYGRLLGRIARPLLRKWHKQFDPARYNGACFLGLKGSVIKSHGAADQRSFEYALEFARDIASKNVNQRLQEHYGRERPTDSAR